MQQFYQPAVDQLGMPYVLRVEHDAASAECPCRRQGGPLLHWTDPRQLCTVLRSGSLHSRRGQHGVWMLCSDTLRLLTLAYIA